MESQQTNQEQRSEEQSGVTTEKDRPFTEDEQNLAEQYSIKPEKVRAMNDWMADMREKVLKALGSGEELDDALAAALLTGPGVEAYKNIKQNMAADTEENPVDENKPEDKGQNEPVLTFKEKALRIVSILTPAERENLFREENQGKLFVTSPVGNEGLVLMLLRSLWIKEHPGGKRLYEQIESKNESQFKEYQEEKRQRRELLKGALPAIKEWFSMLDYPVKLTAVFLYYCLRVEDLFDSPDDDLANRTYQKWESEITKRSKDAEYLKKAEGIEIAMTELTATMIPWEV